MLFCALESSTLSLSYASCLFGQNYLTDKVVSYHCKKVKCHGNTKFVKPVSVQYQVYTSQHSTKCAKEMIPI